VQSISIAIATFNGESYIVSLLDSLCSQTYKPAQIVILDDQSTDNTVQKAADYSETTDVDFTIEVNPKRLGYRKNFLRATELCTSDLIAFCDQDDIWDPQKLARCLSEFEKKSVLMCYHASSVVDGSGRVIGQTRNSHPPQSALKRYLYQEYWENPYGFTEVFKSELKNHNHLHDLSLDHRSSLGEPLAHDQWISFLSSALGEIVFVPDSLVFYRQHENNVVGFVKASGWRHRWAASTQWGGNEYNRVSIDALKRAEILRAIVANHHTLGRETEHIVRAAGRYDEMAMVYAERARLFQASSFLARSAILLRMVAKGTYLNPWGGRFGLNALVKDALFGIARLGDLISTRSTGT
jgi:glycosyltransferase involved in cell wall biosynthesis